MVLLGRATSMLLAEGHDFRKNANPTSTSRMCCITVEWRPDMRDSTFTTRSLNALSLIDSIWNLGMRAKAKHKRKVFQNC